MGDGESDKWEGFGRRTMEQQARMTIRDLTRRSNPKLYIYIYNRFKTALRLSFTSAVFPDARMRRNVYAVHRSLNCSVRFASARTTTSLIVAPSASNNIADSANAKTFPPKVQLIALFKSPSVHIGPADFSSDQYCYASPARITR